MNKILPTLLFASILLPPWLFGGTPRWAVWILNSLCWAAGIAAFLTARVSQRPAAIAQPKLELPLARKTLRRCLFILSAGFVAYCFLGALNARAIYNADQLQFFYRDCIRWLPHSLDRDGSLRTTLDYLAYAAFFWGLHFYLMADDKRHTRLIRVMWVFVSNGFVVAFVSLLQKASDNGKLLWLLEPSYNKGISDYFGPFAYRGNASQYLNLIWPSGIGLYFYLQYRDSRRPHPSHQQNILIPITLVIFVSVFVTVSRGGVYMALFGAIIGTIFLLYHRRAQVLRWALPALGLIVGLCILGAYVGAGALKARFQGRLDVAIKDRAWGPTQEIATRMARDYPVYGTGAGTFDPVFQLYRVSLDEYWPAQLHNDWLETRITLGWIGFLAIVAGFGLIVFSPAMAGAREINVILPFFIYLGLGLTCIHAWFDFPFQVHSVVMTFLVGCAILFSITIRRRGEQASGGR